MLIDRKIAADDGLPLTENQLTVSQTAIFVGGLEVVEFHPNKNMWHSGKSWDD